MKKALSIILVIVLCLSLCACGEESNEDVVGTYAYASGIYDSYDHAGDTLSLHDDFSYDWGSEKGTYKVSGNKILLTNRFASDVSTTLIKQGDFCYGEYLAPIVDDYGRTVTFSEEGRIEHWFRWSKIDDNLYDTYDLTLYEDGSFYLLTSLDKKDGSSDLSKIEGTYSLENNILTLTSDNVVYYLVCTNDGITKNVFKKQSDETVKRGGVERPADEVPVE